MAEFDLSNYEYPNEAESIELVDNFLNFSVMVSGINIDNPKLISNVSSLNGLDLYLNDLSEFHEILEPTSATSVSVPLGFGHKAQFFFSKEITNDNINLVYVSGYYRDFLGQSHQIRRKFEISRGEE